MLKIRLSRVGKSHTPIYRLVVAEKSRAVKRENLEILGLYNPTNKEDKFQVKKDRVLYWIGQGAQPSDTARNLLCDFDVLPKSEKLKKVYGKSKKKNADKDGSGAAAQPAAEATEAGEEEPVAEESETEELATEETPAEEPAEVESPEAKESDAQPATEEAPTTDK